MITHPRLVLAAMLGALALASCSSVSSIIPKPPEPVCGSAIDRGSVLVLDMTGYRGDEARIDAAVRERIGDYRILTDEPVWIPRTTVHGNGEYAGSIATVQSIAADWGCNLLLLLDTKMARTGMMVQSRNEERIWLVHAGRR